MEHEIVAEIKRLAADLGRVPSMRDFREHSRISERKLRQTFSGYVAALHAAGLGGLRLHEEKDTPKESIFKKDILSQLIEHHSHKILRTQIEPATRIAIAGDLHFPWSSPSVISAFYSFIEIFKPDVVVQIGDLFDFYSQSRFPKSASEYLPKQEVELGFQMATEFWATIRRLAPNARCVQILGNHDIRPMKRIIEAAPEIEVFLEFGKWFTFKGVESHLDVREEIFIGDILFQHGHYSGIGKHLAFNSTNSVHGHTHTGGIHYRNYSNSQNNSRILWELDVGYMGDPTSKALGYTPQRMTKWTHGWGAIDEWGPRFIPCPG